MADAWPEVDEAWSQPLNRRILRQASDWAAWLALGVVLAAAAAIRWRVLDVPLSRDEGEYAYAGQLLLQGIPPYEQLYTMKFPGIHAAYALILAILEPSSRGIHLGLLIVNAATTALVFALARRLVGDLPAVAAAASFALLSVGHAVLGFWANAEHFVLLPAISGMLLLIYSDAGARKGLLVASGVLLGCSVLVKQHAFVFPLAGVAYLWAAGARDGRASRSERLQRVALLSATGALPAIATFALLWRAGVFESFWFWTITYARAYTSDVSTDTPWRMFQYSAEPIFRATPGLWALAGLGLTALTWEPRARRHLSFLLPFTLFSALSVFPGFYFRDHYFLLLLPAASLLVGCCVGGVVRIAEGTVGPSLANCAALLLLALAVGQGIYQQRLYLFENAPVQLSKEVFGYSNPFAESPVIAKMIESQTEPDARIAVLGSEPQLFFYANRKSATGYIYAYPLVEDHPFALEMQQQMMAEVEAAKPEILIFVRSHYSWLRRAGAPRAINQWFRKYKRDFELMAVASLGSPDLRLFDADTVGVMGPIPKPSLEIYSRRTVSDASSQER